MNTTNQLAYTNNHKNEQSSKNNKLDGKLIYGYKRSKLNTFLTWLAIIASGFLLRLVLYWKPHWMLYLTFRRCSLDIAEKVLLIDQYNQYFVESVQFLTGVPDISSFIHKGKFRSPDHYGTLHQDTGCSPKKRKLIRDQQSPTTTTGPPTSSICLVNVQAVQDDETFKRDYNGGLGSAIDGDITNNKILNDSNNNNDLDFNRKIRFFENKKIRYIWDEEDDNFVQLRGLDKNVSFDKLQSMVDSGGLNRNEQSKRRQLYGENAIHVEVQPYLRILFEEVLGPFYIFQLFSITIWFNDDYFYYGTCIIIMSLLSLVSGVIQIRRNQEQLRDTVESIDYVKVCRGDDYYEDVESSQLVPGDIVVVPTFDSILQFDGILLNGNVIVNESMLTGESVPVTKTPFPLSNFNATTNNKSTSTAGNSISDSQVNQKQAYSHQQSTSNELPYYDEKEHAKHTLFSGTKVMQTRYYGGVHVKALVIRVGFQTAKGELIRSIMFPKPVDFRFNKQIHKFIGVLACLAFIGFLYSVFIKTTRGADLKAIIISALDLITIVIPPALPAAMTIGIIYAQSRLRSNKIFCISPRSINISGCINCVCFDKTGTLTEDNLSFNEVVPLIEDECIFGRPFDEEVMQTDSKKIERDHQLLLPNGDYSPLMICLASCHSLTIIDQKIIGDPLDLQMFEATGWVLEEPDVDDENKFDLLAPTVVRPPRRKRRTAPELETYATSSEFPSSASSTDEEELDVVTVNTTKTKCNMDVGILRQFPFSSNLQRMSVVTRQFSGSQYIVYCKGAPEKIASLCDEETIPDDFSEVLHEYTRKGFRVLALAYRALKVGLSYTKMQRAPRADIEKDLKFLGLLTLGNLLKPETIPAINKLNKAAIRTIMVTGDNMLTAISVANECGMMNPDKDKTILLEVEKEKTGSNRNSPNKNKKQQPESDVSSQVLLPDLIKPIEQPARECVVLDMQTIKYNRNESDPILGLKPFKEPLRPKLTWHYLNNENNNDQQQQQQQQQHIYDLDNGLIKDDTSLEARLKIFPTQLSRTHLALTGETWNVILKHYPDLINPVCIRGTVFARMAPNQKQQLVEQLQSLDYYVGMCGDGANDSGALRSAHAGISLSDTEASVAAPFTSANANISCVPILICEGRAALVTAFGILKYMALYSMTQFCSVLLLYTMYTNFTDTQFLYEDLFIIATMVAVFGRTEPYPILDSKAPSSSLLSVAQLTSVGLQLALVVLFQLMSLVILWQYPWYTAHVPSYDHDLATHDNFAIFAISSFQCISLAVIFSKGKPYRKPISSNYLLFGALIILTISTVILLIILAEWNVPYISLEVLNVPLEFRIIVICLAAVHFVAAYIGEKFIVDHLIFKKCQKLLNVNNGSNDTQ